MPTSPNSVAHVHNATPPILQLTNIHKSYPGGTKALIDIDLTVNAGEIVCLLGPSGCGKTTLLRVVAGLEQAEQGQVLFSNQNLANVPVHRRGFGFMFQDFALFPHRTVAENIAFGLQMAGIPRAQQETRVEEMLALVNLPGYNKRTIFELSGGERQRVALARSLAPKPALLMLDEPLGSLDRSLREELVEELRFILKEMNVTALYVTHDQDEAMALGDRLVIMQRGRIEQIGTPTEVYTTPATPFVARFLGFTNLLAATIDSTGKADSITTALGNFPLHPSHTMAPGTTQFTLLLRPEAARLAPPHNSAPGQQKAPGFYPWGTSNNIVLLMGRLRATTYHGNYYRIEVEIENGNTANQLLTFQLPAYQRDEQDETLHAIHLPSVGEPIHLLLYTNQATLLPYTT